MTANQKSTIEKLTSELGLGSRADQGIKHVLGKIPINMSSSRANQVIESLEAEIDERDKDVDMHENDDVFGGF